MDAQRTLTETEMATEFPGDWVLVVDPEIDNGSNTIRGRVAFHHPARAEVRGRLHELKPQRWSLLYAGGLRRDVGYLL